MSFPARNSWIDEQRDGATFPAYTDYLYGPDTRPEAQDEPGLHPQSYAPLPAAPIRYTNPRPSQNRAFDAAQGAPSPRNAAMGSASGRSQETSARGYTREDSVPVTDLRSPIRTPGAQPRPRSFADQLSAEFAAIMDDWEAPVEKGLADIAAERKARAEMQSRLMLNASQRRPSAASSAQQSTMPQFSRNAGARDQPQVNGGPIPSTLSADRPANSSLVRSSSATDVDENYLAQMGARQTSMLSSPQWQPFNTNPAPPTQRQPQQQPMFIIPPSPLAPHAPSYTSPLNTMQQPPLVQPNDIITNAYYSFLPGGMRQNLNGEINYYWNVAQKTQDQDEKAHLMDRIRRLGETLRMRRERWQREMQQRDIEQRQAHAQSSGMRAQHERLQQPAQLPSSPPPMPRQQLQPSPFPPPLPSQQNAVIPDQLRAYIDTHISKLYQCLRRTTPPFTSLQESWSFEEIQYANQWIATFKNSIPPEGMWYYNHVVNQMAGSSAGT